MTHSVNRRSGAKLVPRGAAASRSLMMSVAFGLALASTAASFAQAVDGPDTCAGEACGWAIRGKALDNSVAGNMVVGENTERESLADQGSIPFQISVDGIVVDQSGRHDSADIGVDRTAKPVNQQRKTDIDLHAVDVQVKFDGMEQQTMLNISTMPIRRTYQAGEPVIFLATSNYPAFVSRAEVRIRPAGSASTDEPVAVVPVMLNSQASWVMPSAPLADLEYVLRVYDSQGRFDETTPLSIARTDRPFEPAAQIAAAAPGMADDRTAFRNIPVHGGAVTVFGRNVPIGYTIEAFGEGIPLDPEQSFVVQRILPPGDHEVQVAIKGVSKTGGLDFSREINIPANDWFFVALADLTVGKRFGDGGIERVRDGDYDRIYSQGRLAFYLKGKIQGRYLLTASADTREGEIGSLFRSLDSKQSEQVLNRIDPAEYYPVYGDDSTSVDDAPTNGKFYIRLAQGDSHVMWGNYKTAISGSDFINSSRSLYGASAVYRSEAATPFGDRRTELSAHAAQPETLPQTDQFLATGGSAYMLKRQDITVDSETVTVEVRDKLTGNLLETTGLQAGEDYTLNYSQGVLLLKRALSSSSATSEAVRTSALGGLDVYLLAQYEYTPLVSEGDGYAFGGRAQQWIGDNVRVGITGVSDQTGDSSYQATGADVEYRLSAQSFLRVETAGAKGLGFTKSISTDGGLSFSDVRQSSLGNNAGQAWGLKGRLDVKDVGVTQFGGQISGYYQDKPQGFSTESQQTASAQQSWGLRGQFDLSDTVGWTLAHDQLNTGDHQVRDDTSVNVAWQANEHVKLTAGVTRTDIASPSALLAGKSGYNGERFDGGVRVDYQLDDNRSVYGFGQGTLAQGGDLERNDRVGLGGKIQLTEKVAASGEISGGTSGLGGRAGIEYQPTADDSYSLGYRLDPDRATSLSTTTELSGADNGVVDFGARRKLTEVASAYTGSSLDMYGLRQSLAQTYGVTYTPDAVWSVDTSIHTGSIRDASIDPSTGKERSDFARQAVSGAVTYADEETGLRGHARAEFRHEDSEDDTRDLDSYLLSSGVSLNTSPDWRATAGLDVMFSRANAGVYDDGSYAKLTVGAAYRPVDNDRFNALLKYIYLFDQPTSGQSSSTTASGTPMQQRSHILSADASYDLYPWLTVGSKQGLRVGDVRGGGVYGDWQTSIAYLGTARADIHIVKNWDALVEARVLAMPAADTVDYGALAAVYRHFGEEFKIGAGYNFGKFSDDLSDITFDDGGIFTNVIAKF